MGFLENIRLAFAGLAANKMRALLTMLGIIIGISAVIAIVTLGDALRSEVSSTMLNMGGNNITVMLQEKNPNYTQNMGMSMSAGAQPSESDLITPDMLEGLTARYGNDIEALSVTESVGSGKAQDGRKYANMSVIGVNNGYALANNVDIIGGRFFKDRDMDRASNVAVISDKAAEKLFGKGADPIGKEIKVSVNGDIHTFAVVGYYRYTATPMPMRMSAEEDVTTDCYIPLSTGKRLTGASDGMQTFTVVANTSSNPSELAKDIRSYMTDLYERNPSFTCMALSMETIVSEMNNMMGMLSTVIAVIAAISLLVGGIGVMNIMLVSVTERTREIGTRKALGATNGNIRLQFVVEAIIICLAGGVIGIILGVIVGWTGSSLLGVPAFPPFYIIILSVTFSMLIGVFFGYYPAGKAASLDPIEALRYE